MCACMLACVWHTSVCRCRPEVGIRHRPRLLSSLKQNLGENLASLLASLLQRSCVWEHWLCGRWESNFSPFLLAQHGLYPLSHLSSPISEFLKTAEVWSSLEEVNEWHIPSKSLALCLFFHLWTMKKTVSPFSCPCDILGFYIMDLGVKDSDP